MSEPKSIEDKLQIIKARNHGRDSIKDAIVTMQVEAMKYYTPEISEFHIGFEYESFGLHVMNQTWAKMVIDNGTYQGSDDGDSDWYEIGRNLDKVRVKYLDREDIEDEGWIYDKSIDGYYLSKDEDYILKVWNNGCISIDVVPKGMALADGPVPYILIRAIEVKNKSKFKETIKMLAI